MGAPPNETPLERRLRVQRDVQDKAAQYRLYMKTSAAGLEFGLCVVVGVLLGYFADRYFGSGPWGLFVGLGFGLAAGIRTLYRIAKSAMDDDAPTPGEEASDARLG